MSDERQLLKPLAVSIFVLSLGLAFPLHAGIIGPQLATRLNQRPVSETIPVIVTLSEKSPLQESNAGTPGVRSLGKAERREHRAGIIRALRSTAEHTQRGLREDLRNRGVQRMTELWLINALAFDATPAMIEELSGRSEIESIRYDATVQLPRVVPAVDVSPGNGIEDNLDLLEAPALWDLGFTGQGVTIGIMDSGVDVQHPDLAGRWRGGANSWFNGVAATCGTFSCTACDANTSTPCDYLDNQNVAHGTGVAGVAVGGDAGGTAIGVAPGAQWIAAKIFRSDESAPFSVIHAAFQWMLDPDGNPATDDTPDIVNASWGLDVANSCFQEFQPDIQNLKAAGIAVVFAAGNNGPLPNTSLSPGNNQPSFAVGSVGTFTSTTEISDFSSRGPSPCDLSIFPEVVAPGFFVRTADLSFGGLPGQYLAIAGTSFSAPQVAGVMALLLSADPTLTVAELEQAIVDSATDLGPIGPDNNYGNGLVNSLAAFNRLVLPPEIEIIDPVPPNNDQVVDFGNLTIGASFNQTVTVRNVGGQTLAISGLDTTGLLGTPFSLVSDQCSGASLATAEGCTIQIRFAPTAVGAFSGNFFINSNDATRPAAEVSLLGQGVAQADPPQLQISSTAVDLGQIPPGTTTNASLTLSNAASAGPLQIQGFGTASLPAAFSLTADNCSGNTLPAGASCTFQVRFAPVQAIQYQGSFQVLSNDPDPVPQIAVQGVGNNPPPSAQLRSPANGSTGLPTTLILSWSQQPDADGDGVSNTLQVATDPHFIAPVTISVSGVVRADAGLLLGVCGLVALLSPLAMWRSRKLRLLVITLCLAVGLLALVSCGGGGGGSDELLPDPSLRSQTVTGLNGGTTYYWRVLSQDARGGTSQSGVFSFTTR